jgi:hypothetical protein
MSGSRQRLKYLRMEESALKHRVLSFPSQLSMDNSFVRPKKMQHCNLRDVSSSR